jgi:hypothetical protein
MYCSLSAVAGIVPGWVSPEKRKITRFSLKKYDMNVPFADVYSFLIVPVVFNRNIWE